LISLVPKWSGSETGIPLEEFLSIIEISGHMGSWQDADKLETAIFRLSDVAKQFYNGCLQLHAPEVKWQKFKDVFRHKFRDTHTDQYHFMGLQTARQSRNESIQESVVRCRALAQKIVCKVDDPLAHRIHYENADRMLLASFVAGLIGIVSRQVRFSNPQSLDQALKTALCVQEAEKQERFSESFYTSFDNSLRVRSPNPTRHTDHRSHIAADARHSAAQGRSQRNQTSRSNNKPRNSGSRNAQNKAAIKCYECEGFGHFARECPTLLNREANSTNSPGNRNPSERSKRSRSSSEKSTPRTGRECEKKTTSQVNAREV